MSRKCSHICAYVFMVVMFSFTGRPALAQSNSQSWGAEAKSDREREIVARAKAAFERGVVAANQKQWDLALKYFKDSRTELNSCFCNLTIPPELLFNLGVAHAGGGHELVAMAYFNAFLAASPDATNTDAVRKELLRLEVTGEANILNVIKRGLNVAEEVKEKGVTGQFTLGRLLESQARAGDIEGALKSLVLFPYSTEDKLWRAHLESRAASGDASAGEAAWHIKGEFDKSYIYNKIRESLEELGDEKGARQALANITDKRFRSRVLEEEAGWRARMGDFSLAEEILPTHDYPRSVLWHILWFQLELRDLDAARRTVQRILSHKDSSAGFYYPDYVLSAIAIAQLEEGDTAGAEATAKQLLAVGPPLSLEARRENIDLAFDPHIAVEPAAEMQAILGNYDQAISLGKTLTPFPSNVFYIMYLKGDNRRADELGRSLYGTDNWGTDRGNEWYRGNEWLRKVYVVRGRDAEARPLLESDCSALKLRVQLRSGDFSAAWLKGCASDWMYKLSEGGYVSEATYGQILEVAAAYQHKHAGRDLQPFFRQLSEQIGEKEITSLEIWQSKRKLLQRIAEMQARIGDEEGAKATQSRKPDLAAYRGLVEWLKLAADIESWDAQTRFQADLNQAVADAKTERVVDAVVSYADELRNRLNRILFMQRQFSGQRGTR